MIIVILLFLILIIFIVIKRRIVLLTPKKISNNGQIDPLKVLKTRLLDGEITKKEFAQIRKHLGI